MERNLSKGCLRDLEQNIIISHLLPATFNPMRVLVIGIYRYLADPTVKPLITSGNAHVPPDVYDLCVTDGECKLKCMLSTEYNDTIQTNKLHVGVIITIEECKLYVDELDIDTNLVIIIKKLKNNSETLRLDDLGESSDFVLINDFEAATKPLASRRNYYMDLWNYQIPYGKEWYAEIEEIESSSINAEKSVNMKYLELNVGSLKAPYPPILVRVLSKRVLHHFGKSSKTNKWPFQADFIIGDGTGYCKAVMWMALCPLLYNILQVGSVLMIEDYHIKKCLSLQVLPHMENSKIPVLDLEISLNKTNPATIVQVIKPETVPVEWYLPEVPCCFVTRKVFETTSDQMICNIVGVIIYISRYEREKKDDSSGFWVKNWLHILDGTSSQPFILEHYINVQADQKLHPGQLLVCLQVKVKQQQKILTTTYGTQLIPVHLEKDRFYSKDKEFKNLILWFNQSGTKDLLSQKYLIGGYFEPPFPLPTNLKDYRLQFSLQKPLPMTYGCKVPEIINGLHLNERLRITIQCFVVCVEFIPNKSLVTDPQSSSSPTRKRGLKKFSGNFEMQDQPAASSSTEPSSSKASQMVIADDIWRLAKDRIQSFGLPHAAESFFIQPFQMKNKEQMLRNLEFPPNELSQTDKNLIIAVRKSSYFVVKLLTVNSEAILSCIFLPRPENIPSFKEALAGNYPHCSFDISPSAEQLKNILPSACELQRLRFACIVDLYNIDDNKVEIVLVRAYQNTK